MPPLTHAFVPQPEEPEPPVRFPQIEIAARSLIERQVLTPADFERLDAAAQRTAFTVARVGTLDATERLRDLLAEDVAKGGSLREFRQKAEEALGEGFLSRAATESLYRSTVGQAVSEGQRQVLDHPLVADALPYVAYYAVHDSRTRPTHLRMEKLGIQGTNIYRVDDPEIRRLWAPWEWQ